MRGRRQKGNKGRGKGGKENQKEGNEREIQKIRGKEEGEEEQK